ncbi:hypothetical protein SNEBB_000013 [Seison nebaliae]|nr:hypothetical protein SNEBB_000013 [Seison nebaliae]
MQKIVGTTLANISEHLIANIQENDEMNDNLHRSLTSSNGLYQKKRKNYREKDYDSRSILSSQNDDDRRERRQNNRFYDQRHKYYERGTNARRRRRRRKERQSYHTNSSDEMISDESGNWHIEKKRTNYPLKPIINSNYRTVNFTDCGDQKRDNFPKKQTSNYNKYYKSKPFTEYAYMSEKTTISSTSSRESQKEKFDKFGTKNCRLFRTCESLMKEKLRSSSPSSSLDNETINSVKLESVRRSTNFLPSSSSSSSPSFSSSSSSSSISLSVQKLKISKSHRPPIIRRKKQSKQLEKSINGSSNVNEQPPVKPRRFPRKLSNNNNNHTDENSDIIESEYSNLSTYSSLETSNINLSDNNSLTTNTSESYIYGLTNENDNSSTDDVINDSDNDHSDIVDKKSEEVEEDYSKCFQRYVMEERWKSFDVNEQETLKRERNSVSNSNYGKGSFVYLRHSITGTPY